MTLGEFITLAAGEQTTGVVSGTVTQLAHNNATLLDLTAAASSPVITGFAVGTYHGQVLILVNSSGSTVTITALTAPYAGCILGDSTELLGNGSALLFFYDTSAQAWVEVAR